MDALPNAAELESHLDEDGRFLFGHHRDVCTFEGLQLGAGLRQMLMAGTGAW